jgi:membrane-associated phospholipid phosphatase
MTESQGNVGSSSTRPAHLGGSAERPPALFAQPEVRVLGALLVLSLGAYLLADRAVVQAARGAAQSRLSGPAAGLLAAGRVLGKGEVAVFLGLLAAVAGYRRIALQILLALAICAALVWPVKVAVNRERPNGADCVSFPSGDAASSTAAVAPIAIGLSGAMPVAVLVATSAAAARVLVGAHHPSDVLSGMAAGLFSALVAMRLTRRWKSPVDPIWLARGSWAALAVWWFLMVRGRSDETARFLAFFGPALLVAGIYAGNFSPSRASPLGLGGWRWRGAEILVLTCLGLGTIWLFREFAPPRGTASAAWFPATLLLLASAIAAFKGMRSRCYLRAGAAVGFGAVLLLLMFASSRFPADGGARTRSSSADDPTAIPQKLGEWSSARTASWKACRPKTVRDADGHP